MALVYAVKQSCNKYVKGDMIMKYVENVENRGLGQKWEGSG
jgi:hypothetical protein